MEPVIMANDDNVSMCDMYELHRGRECGFALMYWVFVIFSVYLTVLTAKESILVAIGIVTSAVSCVSVSNRRF